MTNNNDDAPQDVAEGLALVHIAAERIQRQRQSLFSSYIKGHRLEGETAIENLALTDQGNHEPPRDTYESGRSDRRAARST